MRGPAYRIGPPTYLPEPHRSPAAGFWVVMLVVAVIALVADQLTARRLRQAQAERPQLQAQLDSLRAR